MTLPAEVDAVVIGAGHNGLVAANRLAEAGWDVLLLEAEHEVGGATRSDREVYPDFVSDTFSAFYPMGYASPVLRGLGLEAYGLTWARAPAVLGHPRRDGSWAMLHRDRELTAGWMEDAHPGDGEAWLAWCGRWDVIGRQIVDALTAPMPPLRAGLRAAIRLPRVGGLSFVRSMLTPAVELFDEFGGDAARLLVAGNACHADIPLDAAGSGFIGLLLTMLGQTVGYPAPVGGAGALSEALRRRLDAHGGRVVCGAPVTKIMTTGGRAVGVACLDQQITVRRAVLASVGAEQLYGGLVSADELPRRTVTRMRKFRRDPATFKIDFALSGPVPWTSSPPYPPGTVHIADSYDDMITYFGHLAAGVIPDRPFLLGGQMTTTDPTRSPAGTESMWVYTHVPQQVRADAGGELTGSWDASEAERFADRMQALIETHAPGFAERILARRILTPADLEARNANLVGGSLNGGTSALDQQLVFRPIPGLGRAETPIRGLYLASASAHPGGSVHGACGMNAARAAIFHSRFARDRA